MGQLSSIGIRALSRYHTISCVSFSHLPGHPCRIVLCPWSAAVVSRLLSEGGGGEAVASRHRHPLSGHNRRGFPSERGGEKRRNGIRGMEECFEGIWTASRSNEQLFQQFDNMKRELWKCSNVETTLCHTPPLLFPSQKETQIQSGVSHRTEVSFLCLPFIAFRIGALRFREYKGTVTANESRSNFRKDRS